MDEQASGCDKGNAILADPPEEKNRRFVGPGFGQCGLEMRGEELGIAIGKSCFRLWFFSQDPVAEKADLLLDLHGSQDLSKIRGGQLRNGPGERARDFLLKQGTVQPHKHGWVFVHCTGENGRACTAREERSHHHGGKAGSDHACLLGAEGQDSHRAGL